MSVGQIAAIIAAGAFVILVVLLAIPLLNSGRRFDEATIAIRKAHEGTDPLLDEAGVTITTVNTQLERVDGITASARPSPPTPRAEHPVHRHPGRAAGQGGGPAPTG